MSYHDEPVRHRKLNREPDGNILFAGNGTPKGKAPVETKPTYMVMNPLAEVIEEGNAIIERVQIAAAELTAQIASEQAWRTRLKEAESTYEMAEAESLAEVIILAQSKEGPLAGVATSSKAYDIILNSLRGQLRTGKLANQWKALERIRRSHELAQVDLRQAETQFAALRKVTELKAELVRAATL